VGDESQLHRLAGSGNRSTTGPTTCVTASSGTQEARPRCRYSRLLPPRPSHTSGAAMTARLATGFASIVTSWKHYRWFHTLAPSSARRDSTDRVGLDRPSARL
jgi:hypothetical protein